MIGGLRVEVVVVVAVIDVSADLAVEHSHTPFVASSSHLCLAEIRSETNLCLCYGSLLSVENLLLQKDEVMSDVMMVRCGVK